MNGHLCIGGEMDGKWIVLPGDTRTVTFRKFKSLGSSPVDVDYILFKVSPGGQCVLAPETYSQEQVIGELINNYRAQV